MRSQILWSAFVLGFGTMQIIELRKILSTTDDVVLEVNWCRYFSWSSPLLEQEKCCVVCFVVQCILLS